uniref:Zf-3CxxC domain-containing protein n=1 Tax=Mesocestoides corti TaxID=53468 RepID=A0A5K3FXZ4_MESCO
MDDESFLQVYKSKVPRQLFAWATNLPDVGCWKCRTGYFTTHEQCSEPSQKPIPCLSVFQWHARMVSSQPEKDTTKASYMMSGVASVVDSDGRTRVFYTTVSVYNAAACLKGCKCTELSKLRSQTSFGCLVIYGICRTCFNN